MPAAAPGDSKAILAALRRSTLLSSLNDRQLSQLAGVAQVRHLPKDALVVEQGDKGVGFYVVVDGGVQVRKGGNPIARLGPGEFFGELALFDRVARSADVLTLEPTTLVVLSRWEFWGFASDQPEVLRALLEAMAKRVAPGVHD